MALEVDRLSKNYPLSHSQLGRLRHLFGSGRYTAATPTQTSKGIWALRDVSFSVNRGEAFGIIGANGSGKSTLLQIIAGIMRPTSGTVQANGRLSALLELGSGFSAEFTGRDNVYLNASLLGLGRDEIDARFADIEGFAGIGDFIDQPIRTYSSGMVLRLAFAVAAHVEPEILIVDEALAVGDIAFRQRCMRKIHDLRGRGTTILFVSHETSDVKALCERCLWLQNGVVQELGEADDVVAKYLSAALHREVLHRGATRNETALSNAPDTTTTPDLVVGFDRAMESRRFGDSRATIVGADLMGLSGESLRSITALDRVVLRISFRVNAPLNSPMAGFLVRNARGENIFGSNTARENFPMPTMAPGDAGNVDFHWTIPDLAAGIYRISTAVTDGDIEDFRVCDYIEDAIEIRTVSHAGASQGYFQLHCAAITIYRNQCCK